MKAPDLILLLAFLAPTGCVSVARAQDAPVTAPAADETGVADLIEEDLMTLEDPSLSSPVRRTDLQAVLQATRSESVAAIEIGVAGREDPERLRATLKLAGPVSKEGDSTELASLKGLGDQASITIGLRCLDKTPEQVREQVVENLQKAIDAGPLAFRTTLETAWKNENPGRGVPDDLSTDDLSARGRRRFLRGINATGGSLFFAGEGTYAAPKKFNFAVAETLQRRQEEHDGYSATASAGWWPVVSPLPYVGLSFSYEDSFEDRAKQQVCEPFGPVGSLRCQSLTIGAPEQIVKRLVELEVRRYSARATSALGLRITRDFANDTTGVEVPVWVLRDGSGLLNGGVSLGWRSDSEEWTFSAFVGSPFGSKGAGAR